VEATLAFRQKRREAEAEAAWQAIRQSNARCRKAKGQRGDDLIKGLGGRDLLEERNYELPNLLKKNCRASAPLPASCERASAPRSPPSMC
jgi:hypothetical protein